MRFWKKYDINKINIIYVCEFKEVFVLKLVGIYILIFIYNVELKECFNIIILFLFVF